MTSAPKRSPRTQTDDKLAAAEESFADNPERADMIARVRRFKASWFELGSALTEMRRTEQYSKWGFANFEDYCRRELHLKRETADKLTGSYAFLRRAAPEVLQRNGHEAPIPSYQSVDFLRRAEEESEAPKETIAEIRSKVLDEGLELPKISRLYRQVVFPLDADAEVDKQRRSLKQAVQKLIELLPHARDEKWIPARLVSDLESPLAQLSSALEQ